MLREFSQHGDLILQLLKRDVLERYRGSNLGLHQVQALLMQRFRLA